MIAGDWLRSGWSWLLLRLSRSILVRATFFALVSVAAALLAPLLEPPLPAALAERIGATTVRGILEVLASSMLVVATFSLGTLISAFAVASSSTTPRVTELLMQDTGVQNAIGVFVGAFLFSLAGLIGLGAGLYGERGGVLLFLVTVVVVVIVVVVFLRWVELVSRVGRVHDAIDRTVHVAGIALDDRRRRPHLGGAPWREDFAARGRVDAGAAAYVRHIDLSVLQAAGERLEMTLRVHVLPGNFVGPDSVLLEADTELDDELVGELREAFDLGPRRTFDLDPRYGVLTLSEIACKALSPGINDPGTSINVVAALTGVLLRVADDGVEEEPAACDRVLLHSVAVADLVDDAFGAIARDGAGRRDLMIRLMKSLEVLAESGHAELAAAARDMADVTLTLAEDALVLDADRARARTLRDRVHDAAAG